MLCRVETIKEGFKNADPKSFVYDYLMEWLGEGLLTSQGEKWKLRRRLLTPGASYFVVSDGR